MDYQPRSISFLDRDGRVKHYGIAADGRPAPRTELVDATRRLAEEVVPADTYGFAIAHDALTAGLGLVYWWANENELHHKFFASPLDQPGKLEPIDITGLACVWELEVIDFERRAWLEDVMKGGDVERYLERSLDDVTL
jgi:hypothetical protein